MIEDIHELEEFKVYNVWNNNGVHLRCYKVGESTIKDIHGREYPYTFSYATEVDITKGNEEYNTVVTWVIESSREVEYCVECYSTSTKKKHLMVGKDLNTLRIDCLNALKSREIYVEMKREDTWKSMVTKGVIKGIPSLGELVSQREIYIKGEMDKMSWFEKFLLFIGYNDFPSYKESFTTAEPKKPKYKLLNKDEVVVDKEEIPPVTQAKYKILTSATRENLEEEVMSYLTSGWDVQGSVTFAEGEYLQSVSKV